MKSVDTGYQPRDLTNPWDEGDYLVRGYAVHALGGGYWPAYIVDRVRGIPDAPRVAVPMCQVQMQSYGTEGEAILMGVSHGVHRVRTRHGLKF